MTLSLLLCDVILWMTGQNKHNFYFKTDVLQAFMDNEIAKKQEKERMKTDRIRRKDGSKKRSLEEEMEEDTKIEDSR